MSLRDGDLKKQWDEEGFVVWDGAFPRDMMQAACEEFDKTLWQRNWRQRPHLFVDFSNPNVYTRNASIPLPLASNRIHRPMSQRIVLPANIPGSIWERIAFAPPLLNIVHALIGPAVLVSSLLFERGSKQAMHQDTWYDLAGDKPGGLAGVWLALEDVSAQSGPLLFVPRSHKWEMVLNRKPLPRRKRLAFNWNISSKAPFEMQRGVYRAAKEHMVQKGLTPEPFLGHAGDMLIWSETLLHGGGHIENPHLTRRSLVLHYRDGG